jgi:predicted acyl esterase
VRPNRPHEYTLDVGNTAMIFGKGHSVRVEISSSNFPHYGRNLNTGLDNNTTAAFQTAEQSILHSQQRPSYVALPVAPISRP